MATPDSLTAAPRSVRALEYVTVAVVLAYVGWTLPGVRTVAGFDVARDGVLQGAGYVLVTLLAVVWAARRTATRRLRRWRRPVGSWSQVSACARSASCSR